MRKIFAIVLALMLALGLTVTASAADGVTVSAWARSDVDAAVTAGIVPDTLPVDYTKPITRAEFCAIAVRLYESLTGGEITGRTTFTDTSDANVEKMAYLGVVNGVGDGRFAPGDTLTREQAATILRRLVETMSEPLPEGAPDFADGDMISDWALDAVGRVWAVGIMNGVSETKFDPKGSYTIEQSIVTMLRAKDVVENGAQAAVIADGTSGRNIRWSLDSTGKLTLSGTGAVQYNRDGIQPWTPVGDKITSIVVEEGVTNILSVFQNLENLRSVTLPSSITRTNPDLFDGCTSLVEINVAEENTVLCSVDGILYNKSMTELKNYPAGRTQTSFEVPEGVTHIWNHAFYDNRYITSITLPASLTYVAPAAFNGCISLVEINVAEENTALCSVDGVLFNEDMTELLRYPAGRTQTAYEMPESVTTLEFDAFSGSSHLTSLTLSENLESVDVNVFAGCSALTDMYFPGNEAQFYIIQRTLAWVPETVTVRFTETAPTYTLTTVEDVYHTAEELTAKWYTEFRFDIAEDKYEEIVAVLDEYIDNQWYNYGYTTSRRSIPEIEEGFDTLYFRVNYRVGTALLPYIEGYDVELSDDEAVLLARTEEILDEIITEDMSEYEKVKAIQDYIVNNTKYVSSAERAGAPYGPILDGQAICEGYSHAMQVMCEMVGIDCIYVSGKERMNHGWNKVKVDDVWYHADVTWDDSDNGKMGYDYFLISDEAMGGNHDWDDTWLPDSPVSHPEAEALRNGGGNTVEGIEVTDATALDLIGTLKLVEEFLKTQGSEMRLALGSDKVLSKYYDTTSYIRRYLEESPAVAEFNFGWNNGYYVIEITEYAEVDADTDYTVYYDTHLDDKGFTWVEVDLKVWHLYVGGEQLAAVHIGALPAEAHMSGLVDVASWAMYWHSSFGSGVSASDQTAEDIAPRPMIP